jgi:hypothetical protein
MPASLIVYVRVLPLPLLLAARSLWAPLQPFFFVLLRTHKREKFFARTQNNIFITQSKIDGPNEMKFSLSSLSLRNIINNYLFSRRA